MREFGWQETCTSFRKHLRGTSVGWKSYLQRDSWDGFIFGWANILLPTHELAKVTGAHCSVHRAFCCKDTRLLQAAGQEEKEDRGGLHISACCFSFKRCLSAASVADIESALGLITNEVLTWTLHTLHGINKINTLQESVHLCFFFFKTECLCKFSGFNLFLLQFNNS